MTVRNVQDFKRSRVHNARPDPATASSRTSTASRADRKIQLWPVVAPTLLLLFVARITEKRWVSNEMDRVRRIQVGPWEPKTPHPT